MEFTREAIADLETLTPSIQERVFRKVRRLSDNFENAVTQTSIALRAF